MNQSALFGLANAAIRELKDTNVRFNEVFLQFRVDYDAVADEKGNKDCTKASVFAQHYVDILSKPDVRAVQVRFIVPDDLKKPELRQKVQF